eukprot:gnl/MRDRNA2_/MRDRNA2_69424_c0_seq2.p1 gnl/MRDRNA2_/MRDRNA2_69424_c0~~gnl/MRDRNA2_/MRDRNA2_69424_c0_seq2.p1  ORF type:complete len:280 (+),score=50.06 gnl/MRDRNA2_/MRDRNA2_69424_c0_seq2:1-840(+)
MNGSQTLTVEDHEGSIEPASLWAPRKWIVLGDALLAKNPRSPLDTLLQNCFEKLRSIVLKICLEVGRPEGFWPSITGQIFDARTVVDLVWASLWIWSQMLPSNYMDRWSSSKQLNWVTFAVLQVHQIDYAEKDLYAALCDLERLVTKLKHAVERIASFEASTEAPDPQDDLDSPRSNHGPTTFKLRSLSSLPAIFDTIQSQAANIVAHSYTFAPVSSVDERLTLWQEVNDQITDGIHLADSDDSSGQIDIGKAAGEASAFAAGCVAMSPSAMVTLTALR